MSFTRTGGIHMAIRNSKIVSSYLKDDFAGTAKKPMAKKEALYLLKLAENMYQDECMELTEINGLIERAEVA